MVEFTFVDLRHLLSLCFPFLVGTPMFIHFHMSLEIVTTIPTNYWREDRNCGSKPTLTLTGRYSNTSPPHTNRHHLHPLSSSPMLSPTPLPSNIITMSKLKCLGLAVTVTANNVYATATMMTMILNMVSAGQGGPLPFNTVTQAQFHPLK